MASNRKRSEDDIGNQVSTLKQITLRMYDFSPRCTALQEYIDFSALQILELFNCANLGFLFNSMLCDYKNYHLKSLTIHEAAPECRNTGYFGREKLEHFLVLHTGLENLTFTDLGTNKPSLQAISAQSATLQTLTMHGSKDFSRSDSNQTPTMSADDVRHIAKECLRLHRMSVDLATKNLSYSSAAAQMLRQFKSITHLEISLPPEDRSLLLDRISVLKIFASVASPHLKRLDINSGEPYGGSATQQNPYNGDTGLQWCIDRVGRDIAAFEITR